MPPTRWLMVDSQDMLQTQLLTGYCSWWMPSKPLLRFMHDPVNLGCNVYSPLSVYFLGIIPSMNHALTFLPLVSTSIWITHVPRTHNIPATTIMGNVSIGIFGFQEGSHEMQAEPWRVSSISYTFSFTEKKIEPKSLWLPEESSSFVGISALYGEQLWRKNRLSPAKVSFFSKLLSKRAILLSFSQCI